MDEDNNTPPKRPAGRMHSEKSVHTSHPDGAVSDSTEVITGEIAALRRSTVTHRFLIGFMGGLAMAVLAGGWVLTRTSAQDAVAKTDAALDAHKEDSIGQHRLLNERIDLLKPEVQRAAQNSSEAADASARTARKVDALEQKIDLMLQAVAPQAAAKARAQKRADAGNP